jgi:TolB-like protein
MSFFEELKRRNVVRVGIAYAVIGWVLAQAAELALGTFGAPGWVMKSFLILLILGLPLALFFAWAFEITPDGLKREKDVDRSQSITAQTGRKLDFMIIAVLAIGIVVLLADRFMQDAPPIPVAREAEGTNAEDEIEVVATEQSIAVLPFVNMSSDEDYFADGLSEELLNLLAKIPGLKVAGRTSSFVFKNKTEDLRAIGDALGVATVLEGSVRRSGDRLRITAQLVKVDDGFHLWSETYDRTMADIFDIQDDVAGEITRALKLRLAPSVGNLTDNPDAYALYLQALPYVASNADLDMLDIVIDLLDRAVALDPEFAKAHELKALAYWATSGERIESARARTKIAESTAAALALEPSLLLARLLNVSARLENLTWEMDLEAAEAAWNKAPGDYNIARILCSAYMTVGYFQRALECSQKMFELEPLSVTSHYRVAAAHSALGHRDEARASWRRAIELGAEYTAWEIGVDHLISGEYDEATKVFDEMQDHPYAWRAEDVRQVLNGIAESERGKVFLDTWVADRVGGAANFIQVNSVYYWYLALGYIDEYWQAIDKVGGEDPYTWSDAEYLITYGNIYPASHFRRHPRYIETARIGGLTDAWDSRGAPDYCNKDSGAWVCE